MSRKVRLFVEGKADKKFIQDYITFLLGGNPDNLDINCIGGWTELPKAAQKFKEHSDADGVNLLIMDADDHPAARREQVLQIKERAGIEFELFLMPNDQAAGNLESVLYQIINPDHYVIFNCFDEYQNCLRNSSGSYHLPNLKSKIYAYLEALLPRNQTEMLRDDKRNYKNTDHWNLNNPYLDPLRKFLLSDDYEYFSEY